MTTPSVDVMPTLRPKPLKMWAIIRAVVVLPLVPVTATIGTREAAPGGVEPGLAQTAVQGAPVHAQAFCDGLAGAVAAWHEVQDGVPHPFCAGPAGH